MSDTTIYNTSGLQTGIQHLSTAHKNLTTLLEDLKRDLSKSLEEWSDNAQSAYLDVQAKWDASAKRQQEIIERMPMLLSNIADGYDATEKKNTGIWA